MKHTSAPWAINDIESVNPDLTIYAVRDLILGNSNKGIELCEVNWHRNRLEECKANAQLIAAAPELLEALEHLVFTATKLFEDNSPIAPSDTISITHPIIEAAKSAIAKAKGQ